MPPLLFFLVTLSAQSQVSVRGELFREITAKPGQTINLNIGVVNSSDTEATISLAKLDYTAGKAGPSPRSLASWMTLPGERLTLAGNTQSEIQLVIRVPEMLKPGSYWSAVSIASMIAEQAPEKGIHVGLRAVVIVQVCITIPGGIRDAQLGQPVAKDGKLTLQVVGTGDEVFVVKVMATDLPDQTVRVFPGITRELEYDISGLADGEHSVRFLLDDGAHFILPFWVKFNKIPPVPVALLALKEQERRQRQTLRGHIYAVLSYGSLQRGLSLQGSTSWRFLNLSAGTDQMLYREQVFQGYTVRSTLNFGPVSVTCGRSWYGLFALSNYGVNLSARRLNLQVSYTPEYHLVTLQAGWRIWKNISVSVWRTAGLETGRRDWTASLALPII